MQQLLPVLFDGSKLLVLGVFIASNIQLAVLVDCKAVTRHIAIPNVFVNLAFGAVITAGYSHSYIPDTFVDSVAVGFALTTAGALALASLHLCLYKHKAALSGDGLSFFIIAGIMSGGPLLL